ncbi:uncharacterized protein EV420DRAFT_1517156 [Desarmillaria tabescens]|uniref:Uncharacterized protein n=1 Tax=Armillaria tabescens TaxID=1929756 RepID=A0AA39NFB6_ARMTA|nr:uncharacterized protein EV420DRAFT_1517156 [Desarmillaria tabescens]KAK0464605.1 hypothetical protein EV420DRAFT_1517156 [Desarmillaria tabescens]
MIIFSLPPEILVDIALFQLNRAGIIVTEWRTILYRRMNVPLVPCNYSYIVPDDKLQEASETLTSMGLPLSIPDPLYVSTGGDLFSKAFLHRITLSAKLGPARFILLYPSSFCSFSPSELESVNHPLFGLDSFSVPLNVPTTPATYASLVRTAAVYKRNDPARKTLLSELAQLVLYNLYDGDYGKDSEDEDDDEEVEREIQQAVTAVRGWTWNPDEEWIGDALAEVVATSAYDELPWMGC